MCYLVGINPPPWQKNCWLRGKTIDKVRVTLTGFDKAGNWWPGPMYVTYILPTQTRAKTCYVCIMYRTWSCSPLYIDLKKNMSPFSLLKHGYQLIQEFSIMIIHFIPFNRNWLMSLSLTRRNNKCDSFTYKSMNSFESIISKPYMFFSLRQSIRKVYCNCVLPVNYFVTLGSVNAAIYN